MFYCVLFFLDYALPDPRISITMDKVIAMFQTDQRKALNKLEVSNFNGET